MTSSAAVVKRTRLRCRQAATASHGARLFHQHIQVVIQFQNLLVALVAAFMPRHAMPPVPDLHIGRVDLGLDRCAHRQRLRVEVGQHLCAAVLVDLGKVQRSQIEAFADERTRSANPMVDELSKSGIGYFAILAA